MVPQTDVAGLIFVHVILTLFIGCDGHGAHFYVEQGKAIVSGAQLVANFSRPGQSKQLVFNIKKGTNTQLGNDNLDLCCFFFYTKSQ